MRIASLILLLSFTLDGTCQQPLEVAKKKYIQGVVLFPDGSPAVGAVVEAVTACPQDLANYVQDVVTGEGGVFMLPPFNAECKRIRFNGRKGLWLKTGNEVFYGKQIGTTPVVEVNDEGSPQRVEIRLGELGSKISLRVWDRATKRFIYAGIDVRRLPVEGLKFGSMPTATGSDGSAHSLILPAGTYEVSIKRFHCGDKMYFARIAPIERIQLRSGESVVREISVDVQSINALASYDNPGGDRCQVNPQNRSTAALRLPG